MQQIFVVTHVDTYEKQDLQQLRIRVLARRSHFTPLATVELLATPPVGERSLLAILLSGVQLYRPRPATPKKALLCCRSTCTAVGRLVYLTKCEHCSEV